MTSLFANYSAFATCAVLMVTCAPFFVRWWWMSKLREFDRLDLPSLFDYGQDLVPPDERSYFFGSLNYSPRTRQAIYEVMCAKLNRRVLAFKERFVFNSCVTTVDLNHLPMQSSMPKITFVADIVGPLLGPASVFFLAHERGKRDRQKLQQGLFAQRFGAHGAGHDSRGRTPQAPLGYQFQFPARE